MNKLINKIQTLKDIHHKLSEQERNAIQGEDLDVGVIVGLKMAMRIVKEQPSAERTGKWLYYLEDGRKHCKCSQCLTSYGCLDTPYCPNCGARMVNDNE